ncbi:MAG: HupE/UreJ family protein [Phormidesmis sp.]
MTQGNILSNRSVSTRAVLKTVFKSPKGPLRTAAGVSAIALFATAVPALAHHPFGGTAPQTLIEGFISGLGHPVLGLDHLAFVIAIGLLAAVVRQGWTVPVAFLIAALMGTGIHLSSVDLPAPELVISASVLLFGLLAATRKALSVPAVVALTGLAGMFHGYAYGEAVVGAEPTPLAAYLIGFTAIQGAIAFTAYLLSRRAIATDQTVGVISVQKAGFAICGAGAILLGGFIV